MAEYPVNTVCMTWEYSSCTDASAAPLSSIFLVVCFCSHSLRSELHETESRLTGNISGLSTQLAEQTDHVEDISAKEAMFRQLKQALHAQVEKTFKPRVSKVACCWY